MTSRKTVEAEPIDGREIVEQNWPYDGPHSYDTVVAAARAMDELTRYLSNATGYQNNKKSLEYGGHVYRVTMALADTLSGLDQVLEQLATAETRIGKDPKVYDDRRDRPAGDTIDDVLHYLRKGRSELGIAVGSLRAAANAASHIGHDD